MKQRHWVAAAQWLTSRGAPTTPLLDVDQPITVGEHIVTFWPELTIHDTWSPQQLAAPLRELHDLTPDANVLEPWDPFTTARQRLDEAGTFLPQDDHRWLEKRWLAVEELYREAETSMPVGVIHGDPHTGNLLADGAGRIVLCDLDELGIGPLAWDLVPQAVGATRFARPDFYREFADAYGTDVRNDPHWPILAALRELVMVTSVLPDLHHRPAVAAEQARRLASLRAGDTQIRWGKYA
ncbi:aminoglycoside phosphotransferase family protein [Nocardia sp. NPDC059239]|uniref:aminoglycoside phosphotransferase family protein n=1 Tax=Nocardia sp. NPDC059239 TaxID=3346785 RepID=UPI0036CDF1AF